MMLQKWNGVLLGLLLIVASDVIAQQENIKTNNSLTGRVTDAASGTPLAGASISIPDLHSGAFADSAGYFHLNLLPAGTFIVDVTFQGYSSKATQVAIAGNTTKDFALNGTVAENDNVTVTGVSRATSSRLTPMSVSVMKQQELYRSPATNIIEALTRKAGVAALTTGPAIAKPFIRGLGYNRVITLNDGLRQEGQQWGDEHGIEIDEYSVQRAEVLRGPASIMYGSDAIGGVLNIQSYIPVPEHTIKANLTGSFNGNNNLFGGHADIAGKINGINFSAYTSGKSAGDYQNKFDGNVLNSRFREFDFGGTFGINRRWGYSRVILSNFDQHTGLIEGDRDEEGKFLLYTGTPQEHTASQKELDSRNLFIPNQRIRHFKVAFDNNVTIGKGRLSLLVGFQHNQREEFTDVEMPQVPESFFDLKTINYNLAYHLPETKGWKTAIGLNGMRQQNENKAEETLIPEYYFFDLGGYVYVQKMIGNKLALSGGARVDNRSLSTEQLVEPGGDVKFAALKKDFGNVSASIGASYTPTSSFTFKANVSRAYRAPSVAELTSNGEHEGTSRYEIGNSQLKSETSFQADLGVEYSATHLSVSFTPYLNYINHYIFLQKLLAANGSDSLITTVGGDEVEAFKYSQQSATLMGFEFSLDLHPHPLDWLHIENTLTYVQGRFSKAVDGSKNLPLIAPLRYLGELRGEWAKPGLSILENIYLKAELDMSAAQKKPFTGYNTETATAGYALLNAGIGGDFLIRNRQIFSFHLALNNVLDKAYQSHLSRLKYFDVNQVTNRQGVFNMGRNFTARLIIPLSFQLKQNG